MKYFTIILMMITFSLNGQELDLSLIQQQATRVIEQPEIHRIITLNDLIDYQEYCYNDSIKVNIEGQSISKVISMYYEYWPRKNFEGNLEWYNKHKFYECGKPYVWIHKQPTFKGFIEYLKSKQ